MAAFTTMALMGLMGAGGMFAGRKLGPKPTQTSTNAQIPVTPQPPAAPASSTQTGSSNTASAIGAAMRKRRQAKGTMQTPGSLLGSLLGSAAGAAPHLAQTTLLGS